MTIVRLLTNINPVISITFLKVVSDSTKTIGDEFYLFVGLLFKQMTGLIFIIQQHTPQLCLLRIRSVIPYYTRLYLLTVGIVKQVLLGLVQLGLLLLNIGNYYTFVMDCDHCVECDIKFDLRTYLFSN